MEEKNNLDQGNPENLCGEGNREGQWQRDWQERGEKRMKVTWIKDTSWEKAWKTQGMYIQAYKTVWFG